MLMLSQFARDEGLPFSAWIARVDPILEVPRNAVMLTAALIILLSLINIGSDVALYALSTHPHSLPLNR